MTETSEHGLSGRRVLVVEDEYFIADDIARALRRLGAEVVGPAPNREEALALLYSGERIDLAVLDINLHGKMVHPVADVLQERGVPFVFATGYDQSVLPERHQNTPRWEKPFDPNALVRTLPKLVNNS